MGVSLAIHHYPFKLAHDSLWPPYKMEAFCLRHHPFTTSHFLERSMTYPARLQKTYWLPFVRTNITLWRGLWCLANIGSPVIKLYPVGICLNCHPAGQSCRPDSHRNCLTRRVRAMGEGTRSQPHDRSSPGLRAPTQTARLHHGGLYPLPEQH